MPRKPKKKHLKIGGHLYSLSATPDLIKMFSLWGRCSHILKTIEFDAKCTPTEMLGVIAHEIWEAIVENRALKVDHATLINFDDAWCQVLVDNADIFIKLLEEVKKELKGEQSND